MTEPTQPTPDDATLPGRAEVTRTAAATDDSTLASTPPPRVRLQPIVSQLHARERYALGCEVARGGMGAILRATDLSIDRTVAMKVALDRASADAEILQRFTQEAKLTGQLEHPNIVPVYDLSSDEQDRAFYTMKFVQGTTLHDILGKLWSGDAATVAQYSLAHLLTIFQKVCDAVAFAHSRNVIHRDLKPANIMVGEYGEVLVMDWGLAKVVGGRLTAAAAASPESVVPSPESGMGAEAGGQRSEGSGLPRSKRGQRSDAGIQQTQVSGLQSQVPSPVSPISNSPLTLDGQIMGSPQYMAPEQAEGEIDKLDARTDIFALGGVLYNILTLHPPVSGKSVEEMLEQIRTGAILPPTSYNPKTGKKKAGTVIVGDKTFPQPPLIPLRHCPGGRIPDSLGAVAMKALALKQADRYQSVPELQKDIEAYQGGFATGAEKASAWRQLALLVKRHKKEFSLAAVALMILVATVTGFVVKVTKEKNRAESERQRAEIERDRAEKTLMALNKTAPTFYNQSQAEIRNGHLDAALENIEYAIQLQPQEAEYHYLKGNILQSQLHLEPARAEYRAAVERNSQHALAAQNLKLCETLLAANGGRTELARPNIVALQTAMREQGRLDEARLLLGQLSKDHQLVLETLRAIIGTDSRRGTVRIFPIDEIHVTLSDTSLLNKVKGLTIDVLTFNGSQFVDLTLLKGLGLSELLIDGCPLTDLRLLQGMSLRALSLGGTRVTDLSPLKGMPLKSLNMANCAAVIDLTPLRGMPLEKLFMSNTRVEDLSPLTGMSLKTLILCADPVTNISPLAGMPLKDLALNGCEKFQDLTPLASCLQLERLLLPKQCRDIEFLRTHPKLKQLGYEIPKGSAGFVMDSVPTVAEFWKDYDAAKTNAPAAKPTP